MWKVNRLLNRIWSQIFIFIALTTIVGSSLPLPAQANPHRSAWLLESKLEGLKKKFDCTQLKLKPVIPFTQVSSPLSDFEKRLKLPQTEIERSQWSSCCGSYGPCPLPYPAVIFPNPEVRVDWSRQRVLAAAKKWIGLKYEHRHIPKMGGLDCSNFTSWVYNFALGVRFSSRVQRQAAEAGRKLSENEELLPGDLLFYWKSDKPDEIGHVAIYIGDNRVLDAARPTIQIRQIDGRYENSFAWARRVIE